MKEIDDMSVINLLPLVSQPPPQISDKQLEEREHTIEQWKGEIYCPQGATGSTAPSPLFIFFLNSFKLNTLFLLENC